MTLGTQVAVLKDGQLMQVDEPQSLFDAPANLFVATFIGSPAMNLAEGRLVRGAAGGGVGVVFADHRVPVPEGAIAEHPGLERFLDRQVILGIRPTSFEDAAFAPPGWPQIKAEARVTERLGSEVDVIFASRRRRWSPRGWSPSSTRPPSNRPGRTGSRPAGWSARGRACGPPGSTATPASDPAAPSTWPWT